MNSRVASRLAQAAQQEALRTLPFRQETFDQILETWCLPKTLVKAILRKGSSYTRPLMITSHARALPNNTQRANIRNIPTGCVLQVEAPDHRNLIIALSWDLVAQTTYGIVLGCTQSEVKSISHALRFSTGSAGHPMLALAPFAELQFERLNQVHVNARAEFEQALRATGLQRTAVISDAQKSMQEYKILIKSVMTNFRNSGDLVTTLQRFRAQLDKIVLDLETTSSVPEQIRNPQPAIQKYRLTEQLAAILDGVNDLIEKSRLQTNEASLLMSALWNLVAQHDNLISQSIAQQSKSISEQARMLAGRSVELGQETRNITTEAKNIANDTKRDSTSMVAIATLTMIFLPLSFVATLLGMPIFNWQAKTPEKIVQRWQINVYCYAALPLTLFVLSVWACWLWYSEHQRKKNAKAGEVARGVGIATSVCLAAGIIGVPNGTDLAKGQTLPKKETYQTGQQ